MNKTLLSFAMIVALGITGLSAGRFGDYLGAHVLGDVITDVRRGALSPRERAVRGGGSCDRVANRYEDEIKSMEKSHRREIKKLKNRIEDLERENKKLRRELK
ncbi:hypothetical protein KAW80_00485 [Candidatus Babeliales bacterium]|nr:hypothetical protein [Candidatus Babeliales bacterium]